MVVRGFPYVERLQPNSLTETCRQRTFLSATGKGVRQVERPCSSTLEEDVVEEDARAAGGNRSDVATMEPSVVHRDLHDALFDLDQAEDEAREEGFPALSGKALGNARRLLYAMYRTSPRRFEIYPTPDGEIAIDAPGEPGRSVLLLCGSDGGALCLVNMNGAHRRARYSDTHELPDGFVNEALSELEQAG